MGETSKKNIKTSNDLFFAKKIYLCIQLLGGKSDILSIIGSWKQTLSDENVIEALDYWIECTLSEQKDSIAYVEQWHKK